MPPVTTTLNDIRADSPCESGWKRLLKHLGKTQADDEPLPLTVVLDSNGLFDCLWCLRAVSGHDNLWGRYAVWCASQVEHLMTDSRNVDALAVAKRYLIGEAPDVELLAAKEAVDAAQRAANPADPTWRVARAVRYAISAVWRPYEASRCAVTIAYSTANAVETAVCANADRWLVSDTSKGFLSAQERKLRQILEAGEWIPDARSAFSR